MSWVYRDMVLRRASRSDIEKAHDQAGDMVRILILGSTQIIPLPVIPTLLVILLLKGGKALGIRVVPSSWHEVPDSQTRADALKLETGEDAAGKDQGIPAENRG